MSYKQKLTDARNAPAQVTVDRDGAPPVSGSVIQIDNSGATIKDKSGVGTYIEFTSIRGVSLNGWDIDALDD